MKAMAWHPWQGPPLRPGLLVPSLAPHPVSSGAAGPFFCLRRGGLPSARAPLPHPSLSGRSVPSLAPPLWNDGCGGGAMATTLAGAMRVQSIFHPCTAPSLAAAGALPAPTRLGGNPAGLVRCGAFEKKAGRRPRQAPPTGSEGRDAGMGTGMGGCTCPCVTRCGAPAGVSRLWC
jgi:hypothetical protein